MIDIIHKNVIRYTKIEHRICYVNKICKPARLLLCKWQGSHRYIDEKIDLQNNGRILFCMIISIMKNCLISTYMYIHVLYVLALQFI